MTFWWLNNISRAKRERNQLAELAERADWLKNLSVTIGDGNIAVEFDIEFGENIVELILTYPVVFPDAPPLVKTRNGTRISGHQYGASGELCLEYRPDNWASDISGVMMIESAFKLLSGEDPQNDDEAPEIIDGHALSIGQTTRTAIARFVITNEDRLKLEALEENTVYTGSICDTFKDKKACARLMYIGNMDSPIWQSESKFCPLSPKSDVYIINRPKVPLPSSPSNGDVMSTIEGAIKDAFNDEFLDVNKKFYLLTCKQDSCTLYWVSFKAEDPCVIPFRTLTENPKEQRLPQELRRLQSAKVGIVGCGSLGSKIATQLTRSEIGSLLLIDDDIFFEANLVRHELCSSDIGFHKTVALRSKLLSINQNLNIETKQIRFGGQESSESLVAAMTKLSECDLIIDATADFDAFNYISAVCRRGKIPVVWGSVFAGGIGGIIGRAIPDHDPEPLDAKQQIRRWCEAQGVDAPESSHQTPYGAQSNGQTEIASDADIAVIAAHVTRFAHDVLCKPDDSIFPYSAYVLGLSRVWIFDAPFDTRPINYTNQKRWSSDEDMAQPEELTDFLTGLFPPEEESGT